MRRERSIAKFDDIVEKVNAAKSTPDSSGGYHDYIELLKLYDKNNNGTMMLAELENILANLGDEIPKEDVQKLFAELCDPEDEEILPIHAIRGQTDRQGISASTFYNHSKFCIPPKNK